MAEDNSGDKPKEPKRVSKIPPPLEPVKGYYPAPKPKAPNAGKPDWAFWQHMPALLWEACALSLNINPDNMKHHPQSWMTGPGSAPIFTEDSFPSDAVKTTFDKRLRLLGEHYESEFFTDIHNLNPINPIYVASLDRAKVTLRNFAAWGLHMDFQDMPCELVAMAQTPGMQEVTPAEKSKAESNNVDSDSDSADTSIAELFDPVTVAALEKMFSTTGKWKNWAGRANRNGLKNARTGRGKFNPYKAALWFLKQGMQGWDLARCKRVLANNLPTRSKDNKHLLANELPD